MNYCQINGKWRTEMESGNIVGKVISLFFMWTFSLALYRIKIDHTQSASILFYIDHTVMNSHWLIR